MKGQPPQYKTIGGKRYTLFDVEPSKASAKGSASEARYRKGIHGYKSFNVRVIKVARGYAIYRRRRGD